MTTKLTLRLPQALAEQLRAASQAEGRSLNETAVRLLMRALGEAEPDEWWRELGDLVEVPPRRRYDPEAMRRFHATPVGLETARGIMEELDWSRGTE